MCALCISVFTSLIVDGNSAYFQSVEILPKYFSYLRALRFILVFRFLFLYVVVAVFSCVFRSPLIQTDKYIGMSGVCTCCGFCLIFFSPLLSADWSSRYIVVVHCANSKVFNSFTSSLYYIGSVRRYSFCCCCLLRIVSFCIFCIWSFSKHCGGCDAVALVYAFHIAPIAYGQTLGEHTHTAECTYLIFGRCLMPIFCLSLCCISSMLRSICSFFVRTHFFFALALFLSGLFPALCRQAIFELNQKITRKYN